MGWNYVDHYSTRLVGQAPRPRDRHFMQSRLKRTPSMLETIFKNEKLCTTYCYVLSCSASEFHPSRGLRIEFYNPANFSQKGQTDETTSIHIYGLWSRGQASKFPDHRIALRQEIWVSSEVYKWASRHSRQRSLAKPLSQLEVVEPSTGPRPSTYQ